MNAKCPACEESVKLDINEYDADDFFECPECSADLIIKVRNGEFVLKKESSKYDDFEEEFSESFD